MHVEPITDPATFLTAADALLAADPVVGTIPATMARRFVDHPDSQGAEDWFAVVQDEGDGAVVGALMRTAPFAPRPVHLLPMPPEAARAAAAWVREHGEDVSAASGEERTVRAFAEALGGTPRVVEQTRLWEVREVVAPRPASGRLRLATREDLALTTRWYADFAREAAEQAGHEVVHAVEPTRAEMLRRVDGERVHLWEDDDGTVVHLTGVNPPSVGVARIAPVFTPAEQRGKGYAANAVAELSSRLLAAGHRVCLFTDQENAVSNALYARIGFRPVLDMCEIWLT